MAAVPARRMPSLHLRRAPMATVETQALRKEFVEVPAVDGVDLTAQEGEFLVLLGPSGCGKTTLLRMIAGLEQPTRGDILIGGRVVNALPPRTRKIAMVFQSYALYPHLTVDKNIAFPLQARGRRMAARSARVEWAATMFGIERLLARKPRQLSGGERQRVALARAMVREPRRLPPRRAALQPRRQAPHLGPRRAEAVPAPAGHHHDLRHPRSGGGDGPGRPHRGDERGPGAPARHAAGGLRRAGGHLRRHLPRLAADEPGRAGGRAARLPARAPRPPEPAPRPGADDPPPHRPGGEPRRRPPPLRHASAAPRRVIVRRRRHRRCPAVRARRTTSPSPRATSSSSTRRPAALRNRGGPP